MCPRAREYNNLFKVIIKDVLAKGKLALLLLFLVVITGFVIVLMTQQMRIAHSQYESLALERGVLNSEWTSLLLEEKILAERGKIAKIAVAKLKMKQVSSEDETIVMIKR